MNIQIPDEQNVLHTIYQLFGLILSSLVFTTSFFITLNNSDKYDHLIITSLCGYFITLLISLSTLILFLAAFENGPYTGNYKYTMTLGYNIYVQVSSFVWYFSQFPLAIHIMYDAFAKSLILGSVISFAIIVTELFLIIIVYLYYKNKNKTKND